MDKRPIAVFDSGVGGLPYLQWIRNYAPNEDYVYLADRKNFPYGEKTDEELNEIIVSSVERFIKKTQPKLMVIACNTASVVALSELRKRFSIPFIGVVPAVKPAAELSKQRAIGILATRRTVEEPYTENLIKTFASDCKVVRYGGAEIVELVERNFFTSSKEEKAFTLSRAVDFFRTSGVDTLVVACTHFIFVEELLNKMLNNTTTIIDSREGVARQTLRILKEKGILGSEKPSMNTGRFFISGDGIQKTEDERYSRFAQMFELEWSGNL